MSSYRYRDPILKINGLIFIMGMPIPVRRHLYIETRPKSKYSIDCVVNHGERHMGDNMRFMEHCTHGDLNSKPPVALRRYPSYNWFCVWIRVSFDGVLEAPGQMDIILGRLDPLSISSHVPEGYVPKWLARLSAFWTLERMCTTTDDVFHRAEAFINFDTLVKFLAGSFWLKWMDVIFLAIYINSLWCMNFYGKQIIVIFV